MDIHRVSETWQLAAVHYLRIQVALSLDIPIAGEIDEKPGEAVDYVLLVDDGVPAATGRLRVVDGKAKFERITVGVPYQRKGVGRLLMAELEAWARERGLREGYLTSKAEVEPFYTRIGYTRDGPPVAGGRFTLVRVNKAL